MNKFIIILIISIVIAGGVFAYMRYGVSRDGNGIENSKEETGAEESIVPSSGADSQKVTLLTYTSSGGEYSVIHTSEWFPSETSEGITVFTKSEEPYSPSEEEGFTLEPSFVVSLSRITDISGVNTTEEWLEANGISEGNVSTEVKDRQEVRVNGMDMIRVIQEAGGAQGDMITYVYFIDLNRMITVSHFPYNPESSETQDFTAFMESFRIGNEAPVISESPGAIESPIAQSVPILAEFDNKIVYKISADTDEAVLQTDCDNRGGSFNTCGSICDEDAEACLSVCAYTCEFD